MASQGIDFGIGCGRLERGGERSRHLSFFLSSLPFKSQCQVLSLVSPRFTDSRRGGSKREDTITYEVG